MARKSQFWQRATKSIVIDFARSNESELISQVATALLTTWHKNDEHPSAILDMLENLQPSNPLRNSQEELPSIDLLVVASRKDYNTLPFAISHAKKFSENPIRMTTVITPSNERSELPELGGEVIVKDDEESLPVETISTIERFHPPGRRGWILQQALTFLEVASSSASGVLVMDADTLLLRERTFLRANGAQLLVLSNRYHREYERHASNIWGPRTRYQGLSFVTHHQLMRPEIVREMFESDPLLYRWISSANLSEKSPISEYHSYGRWLSENYPSLSELGRWGNYSPRQHTGLPSDIEEQARLAILSAKRPLSASFHSYRQV